MKLTRLLCVATALLLPVIVLAQTATQQPARQTKDATRDGSRAQDAKQKSDANSPGKSENAPGQQKKSKPKAKSTDKKSTDKKSGDKKSKEKK